MSCLSDVHRCCMCICVCVQLRQLKRPGLEPPVNTIRKRGYILQTPYSSSSSAPSIFLLTPFPHLSFPPLAFYFSLSPCPGFHLTCSLLQPSFLFLLVSKSVLQPSIKLHVTETNTDDGRWFKTDAKKNAFPSVGTDGEREAVMRKEEAGWVRAQ